MGRMDRATLARRIDEVAHLDGAFTLRSGRQASTYFDKYRFEAEPALLAAIAEHMAEMLPDGTEVLAGLELGGIPLATALSLRTGLPAAFVRKEPKRYGTRRLAEGADVRDRRTTLVEDVVSTGGQIVRSAGDLRRYRAIIGGALCVLDRRAEGDPTLLDAGVELRSVFTRSELDALVGAR